MHSDRFEDDWDHLRDKAKDRWGRLSDDDIEVVEGKRSHLENKLQAAYGFEPDEARREIDAFFRDCE